MTIDNCIRICVWSGPRNVSTALMYSFAQRTDTRVIDEPLYGHYLRVSGAPHPAPQEVIDSMDSNGERVVREVMLGPCDRPVLFMKNMPHHLVGLDWSFLKSVTNVILNRHPRDMLPSLAQKLETPILRDTSFDAQIKILELAAEWGQDVPVIDSRELLLNPRQVLSELCKRIGLPFEEQMLSWEAGTRPEDGVWAKYWYSNVHKSTGFALYTPKTEPFPARLQPLLDECMPYYDKLYEQAIKADPLVTS